jgi:hypothetical protein
MKVIGAISLILLVSVMVGCADGAPDYNVTVSNAMSPTHDGSAGNSTAPISITNATNNSNTTLTNITSTSLNPAHGKPGHRCDIPVGQPLNSSPIKRLVFNPLNVKSVDLALNPPHGQPHHRCDIAVGQPLNSKPPLPNSPATTTTTTTNTAGLNPKHGEPGHRCDIPVGQPLNSKPAKPAAPTTSVFYSKNNGSVAK